jgi:hypothetical protein
MSTRVLVKILVSMGNTTGAHARPIPLQFSLGDLVWTNASMLDHCSLFHEIENL